MSDIPVSFEFKEKPYSGFLSPVHGGGTDVYYLMINNFYFGRLRLVRDEWKFDTNAGSEGWESLADYFGQVVIAWYQ